MTLPATAEAAAAPWPLDKDVVPVKVAPEDVKIETPSCSMRVTPAALSSKFAPKKDFVHGEETIETIPLLPTDDSDMDTRVSTPLLSINVDARVKGDD